ncbi:MAG: hypothetical protein ACFFCZ_23025 [Promethearchaeota archaeon]
MKTMKPITKETTEVLETHWQTHENICRVEGCIKPAHCNEHGCWRQRTTKISPNCEDCEERLCRRHWRKLVDSI